MSALQKQNNGRNTSLILQTKGSDAINIIYESAGILILATSAWIMTKKDYMSMKKEVMRESLQKEA